MTENRGKTAHLVLLKGDEILRPEPFKCTFFPNELSNAYIELYVKALCFHKNLARESIGF